MIAKLPAGLLAVPPLPPQLAWVPYIKALTAAVQSECLPAIPVFTA
jgi:hypothetical protein